MYDFVVASHGIRMVYRDVYEHQVHKDKLQWSAILVRLQFPYYLSTDLGAARKSFTDVIKSVC